MNRTCEMLINPGEVCGKPAAFTYGQQIVCYDCAYEGRHNGHYNSSYGAMRKDCWVAGRPFGECEALPPYVGMPATVRIGSDRHAGTIVFVSSKATKITVQQDKAIRTDSNGMSDSQTYEYERDPNGRCDDFFRNAAGGYGKAGHRITVTLGIRKRWYDYSF